MEFSPRRCNSADNEMVIIPFKKMLFSIFELKINKR